MLTIFQASPQWAYFTTGSDDQSAEVAVARSVLAAAKRRIEYVPTLMVCGHNLDESQIDDLIKACDSAAQERYDIDLEKRADRAADFASNWEA